MQSKSQQTEMQPEISEGAIGSAGQQARNTSDDWSEEACRQAQALRGGGEQPTYSEFRRKLAGGELLSRAAEKLAAALRFSGRITITFHQGKMTKTVMEEAYFKQRGA